MSLVDAFGLEREARKSFLPPERVSVDEWTGKHRWLTNTGGGYVGLWDHRVAPYLVEPMRALTSPDFTTVAIVGPAQSGKSEVANNWMLASIDTDPAGFLRFMQTDDAMRSYVKNKINPMLEAHEQVAAKQGQRPIDDSIGFKRFRGMTVEFLAAARSNLISKSAPRIVADEIDAYDHGLGDVKNLLDVRRQTFGRDSMLCMISHPDRAGGVDRGLWNAGIMAVYADSTRASWWWPCPACGCWSSPVPGTPRHMALQYPEDAPLYRVARETRLVCPSNGCEIEDGQRRDMNRLGKWVSAGQIVDEEGTVTGEPIASDPAGYWIVGAMSPFLLHGIGGLASARVKAQRAIDAGEDDQSLREVMTKQWGIPYDSPRRVGSVDAQALADRAEPGLRLGMVPEGVRFITAAADVQATRFEGLVRGWGVDGESWVLSHWTMTADTAVSPVDWDGLIKRLMLPLPLADGSGRMMRVHGAGYDSGGADGVTLQAYGAWQRAKRNGETRMRGKLDGRDAWSILPLKGMSGPNASRLAVVYPDSQKKERFAASRGQVPLGLFNPSMFKDDLAVQLMKADSGWSVHTPAGLRGNHMGQPRTDEPPHTFYEQLVAEERTGKGTWVKKAGGARNEALDLMVMTHVVAHLHGLQRIKWNAPRAWHAEWDSNSGVFMPGIDDATVPAVPRVREDQQPFAVSVVPVQSIPSSVVIIGGPKAQGAGRAGRMA